MSLSADLDPTIKKLVREVSKKLNIDEDEVEAVVKSQFSFVVSKIREYNTSGEDSPILLNYLGKFMVKKNRRNYLNKYKADNDKQRELLDKRST